MLPVEEIERARHVEDREADDADEALRIASMHPAAQIGEAGGWAVELIPMDFYLGR